MDLSLPHTRWENVRKRILVAIEEEQRKNAKLTISPIAPPEYPQIGQVEEGDKGYEEVGSRVFVTVDANDG